MAHRLKLLAATAAVLALVSPVAYAATGSPPVTHPDTVKVEAGADIQADLTANDSDPDGDDLAVCRIGDDVPRKLQAFVAQGQLVVLARRGAEGTYTFTYYACDTSYLTPGQVTIKVGPPAPSLDVIPLEEPPGRMRIVSTFKHRTFRCEWRPVGEEEIEGRATVPPLSSVVIRVHEAEVQIDCNSAGYGYSFLFAPIMGKVVTRR